jgi:hypothetical protein
MNIAVRRRANSMRWMILIVLGVGILLACVQLRRLFHSDEGPGDASPLAVALIVTSSYIIASFLATALTNFIWWLTPSMRDASIAARAGLGSVSFGYVAFLLAMQAAVVIPICLAQIYLGLVMR